MKKIKLNSYNTDKSQQYFNNYHHFFKPLIDKKFVY